jgi:serine/threonine protein kinase
VVFLAHELQLNRKVAIKVLLPELLYTDGMDRRFKQEARVAAKLDHPNILVIYGVRESKDLLFIVTKLVDGRPLSGVLRRGGQIPLPVAQFIIRQVADALNYAHGEGVVHRDVKPANVMVDRKGNLVVMDFGIAKAVDDANLTRTGLVIGTPAYMSPEQCLSQRVTYAADQYSLGTVAYELLTGVTPFRGSSLEMQWAHVKETPEPVRVLRPDCPPALEALVMRMLAKSPGDRWGSLQDVVDALTLDPASEVAARQHLASIVAGKPGAPLLALPVTPVSPIPRTPLATEIVPAPAPPPAAPPAAPVPPPPPPPTISLTPRQLELEEGESADVVLAVDPPDGSGAARPVWSTTNASVAQVSDSGAVTAVSAGVAGVVVTLGGVTARCSVHVDAARAH